MIPAIGVPTCPPDCDRAKRLAAQLEYERDARDRERQCTCLGSCKGPDGLAPGWRCALGRRAQATEAVDPTWSVAQHARRSS